MCCGRDKLKKICSKYKILPHVDPEISKHFLSVGLEYLPLLWGLIILESR